MDTPELVAFNLARNMMTLRQLRSLTQEALAKAAGVPRSTIANLESGTGNPSLTVLLKAANALAVPIEELLAAPRADVRHWKSAELTSTTTGAGVTQRTLMPESLPDEMLVIMDLEPSGTMRGTPHLHGTREYFTCLNGQVVIYVAGEKFELEAGDALAFAGSAPHSYRNPSSTHSARGVSAVILRRG